MVWTCQDCGHDHAASRSTCKACGSWDVEYVRQRREPVTASSGDVVDPHPEPDVESSPSVKTDGSLADDGFDTVERAQPDKPSKAEQLKTSATPYAISARSGLRTVVQLAGIALIFVGIFNLFVAGSVSEMITLYPTIRVVAIADGYLVRFSDVLAVGAGAAVAWFA